MIFKIGTETTVGELKEFLANVPDDALIYTECNGEIMADVILDHNVDGELHELYIESRNVDL